MKTLKLTLLTLATMLCSSAWAQWQKPVAPTAELQFSTLESDTTMYYLYNEKVGAFYVNGGAAGTQTAWSTDRLGLKVFFSKNLDGEGNWDEKTILIHDLYPRTGVWYNMYIWGESIAYIDRTVSDDYFWEFEKNADGTYRFRGAALNPTFNPAQYPSCYWGIDLTMADSILYPLLDVSQDPTGENYLVDWKLVPINDSFVETWLTCSTAEQLAKLIAEAENNEYAEELANDIANAMAVYNNSNSTLNQLNDAIADLKEALKYARVKGASEDNPKDATFFIQNPNFDENMDGWGFTYEFGKTADILTRQARTDSSDGYTMTNFIEASSTSKYNPNLSYNALGDGSIYQVVKGLPAGKYEFALLLHNTSQFGPNPCTGTYLFAENADMSQEMEIHNNLWIEHVVFTFATTGGDVTIGMKTRNSTANWIAMDNITLTYYGEVQEDPEKVNLDAYIAACEERFPAETFDEEVMANNDIKDNYLQKLEDAKIATDNYAEVRSALEEAVAALDASISEYKKFKTVIDNAYAKCAEFDGTKWASLQDALYDYIMLWEESYQEGTVTTEDLSNAETEFSQHVFNGIISMMEPGDDITPLLINPQFEEGIKGWTNIPAPTGDTYNKFVLQWNGSPTNLNYFQTLTGLPNGQYKVTCQGCYRYGWTQDAANNVNNKDAECASIYANDASAPLMPVFKDAKETADAGWTTEGSVDGVTYYIPYWDGEWSYAFNEGGFSPTDEYNTVIGTVKDGILIIGIRVENGLGGECTQFDNFHLYFVEAQGNEEARNTLGEAIAEADSIVKLKQNTEVLAELNAQLESAKAVYEQTTLTGNAYTNAYTALLEKLNSSKESVDTYEKVSLLNEKAEKFDKAGMDAYLPTKTSYEEGTISDYETAFNQFVEALKAQTTPGSDMTDAIINFDFEHGTTGWLGGLPNPTGNSLNMMALKWNAVAAPYNFYQTITGLQNGKFKITCQGCYRYGEVQTAANNVNNKGAECAMLYGNSQTAPIMPAFKGAHAEQDGAYTAGGTVNGSTMYIPYWDSEWADAFRTGGFAPTDEYNTVVVEVTDGTLTLGIKKEIGIDLECIQFDNFALTFLGNGEFQKGDVNEDGKVDINDVVAIINVMAGTANWPNANVNGDEDGNVDINDVVSVINIMAGNL